MNRLGYDNRIPTDFEMVTIYNLFKEKCNKEKYRQVNCVLHIHHSVEVIGLRRCSPRVRARVIAVVRVCVIRDLGMRARGPVFRAEQC